MHATQQSSGLLIAIRDRIRGWMVGNIRPSPPGCSVDVMSLTSDPRNQAAARPVNLNFSCLRAHLPFLRAQMQEVVLV